MLEKVCVWIRNPKHDYSRLYGVTLINMFEGRVQYTESLSVCVSHEQDATCQFSRNAYAVEKKRQSEALLSDKTMQNRE